MLERRKFLTGMSAVVGSYMLSACGGGGGGSGTSASANNSESSPTSSGTSTGASAGTSTSSAATSAGAPSQAATSTGAPQVVSTPPATSTPQSGTSTDTSQPDTSNSSSPTQTPASANGTIIPPAASIIDASGTEWTVTSGAVFKAGQAAGSTQGVTLLLWYGGGIYLQSTSTGWQVWTGSAWSASADPRAAAATSNGSSPIHFYGVNCHYVQGGFYTSVPLATQAATMADLGIKVSRQDAYTSSDVNTIASTVVPGLAPVVVLPCLVFYPYNDPSVNGGTPTETTAYNYAYALAAHAATLLAGVVPVVEFGNEYDIDAHNAPIQGDGESVADFDNSTWPIWRGALRGSYDGWRSVDKTAKTKIICNATAGWLHFGWLEGMMTGTQPDGSTGHSVITPDLLQWHWYSNQGDIENATGGSGAYNVLQRLKTAYGLPIMITELGVVPGTESTAQAFINGVVPEMAAAFASYGVVGTCWYELYEDSASPGYGLMTNGSVQKPRYATMKGAISANPMS
jgi:Glycosyl hydrolase catalytic core